MTLGEFLKAQIASREPWNCSTMPADWCVELGYPDFAAAWRQTIEPTACDQAQAIDGGLLKLWREGIGDSLRVVVDEIDAGDIAVVEALGFQVGAIFTGDRWALRGGRGLHFLAPQQVAVLEAWRP